ncbi:MAG TPA: hypothetical protein VMU75_10365 [Acidimicrobiales bacterium]|nr:hypothetical protein [Acidimicrobiales bacterium]
MADLASVASFATAGGTLVLAVATFYSVRSANRAARTAERALQIGLRPLLMPSRLDDPPEKLMWADRHWAQVVGGRASVEALDGTVYLAMSLRNVGSGIAVLHGWYVWPEWQSSEPAHAPGADFRTLSRDQYVPPGDVSFFQAAIREPDDPALEAMTDVVKNREIFTVDLLYSDHDGGQRTISRFTVSPREEGSEWLIGVTRHWNLDRPDPR